MNLPSRSLAFGLLFLGLTGVAAQAAAIKLSGGGTPTCPVGNCFSPDAIVAGTPESAPFSFLYTATSGDKYQISGSYVATYGNSGTVFQVYLSADYMGTGNSIANDSFTVDVLQDVFDNSPGVFDGLYTESIPLEVGPGVGAGSTVSAQLLWDGESVGVVGPFTGTGSYYGFDSATLTGLTGTTLAGDFQFNFNFQAGTQNGAGDTSPTPEPSEIFPTACLFLLGFAWLKTRRSDKIKFQQSR